MGLEENIISEAIIKTYFKELLDYLDVDVSIVGAGPSGLAAGYNLSKSGCKTAIFEKNASIGGGMWGGGMGYNKIVIQEEAKRILDEHGINYEKYQDNYYVANAIEVICSLGKNAIKHGAKIFNLVCIEDAIIKHGKVEGIVINSAAVNLAKLHVDPIAIKAKYVIDATGHSAEIVRTIQEKGERLNTDAGKIVGEGPMYAELGEKEVIMNTKEVYPNLWVSGMAANTVFGGKRMGPIFGSMLLSGEKAAKEISKRLQDK